VCKLSRGNCSVKYIPTSASQVVITANYARDKHNPVSTGTLVLTVSLKTSKTTLSCTASSATAGSSKTIKCTAHMKGYYPTGTVTWSQSGLGSVTFSSSACTLALEKCFVTLTGTTAGTVSIQASYSGDPNNKGSSATCTITIKK
jgi:hypothetical protein